MDGNDRETGMRKVHRIATVAAVGCALFYGGFAVGQRTGPNGDRAVEQHLLASIDLAKAIEGFPDRQLLLSRVTVAPGGNIGLHDHADDPTVVYLSSGALANHHDDGGTDELRAGQAFVEFDSAQHWVENKSAVPAVFVFASVSRRR